MDFPADQIDTALGVGYVEGDGPGATEQYGYRAVYSDAVGDLDRMTDVYGPSVGWFQNRSIRVAKLLDFAEYDRWRYAWMLRDPFINAIAAKHILAARGWGMWSAHTSGAYLPHVGQDYALVTGHPRADQWNA